MHETATDRYEVHEVAHAVKHSKPLAELTDLDKAQAPPSKRMGCPSRETRLAEGHNGSHV